MLWGNSSCRLRTQIVMTFEPVVQTIVPGKVAHFEMGGVSFEIVSDGAVVSGPPEKTHPHADAGYVNKILDNHGLPHDRLDFAANILIAESHGSRTMFDAGLGPVSNPPAWGRAAGDAFHNMRIGSIHAPDRIALTHAHGEHIGGLIDEIGNPRFPNAEVYAPFEEHAFWTDPIRTGPAWAFDCGLARTVFSAVDKNLKLFASDPGLKDSGVTAIPTPGHTITHTAYRIKTEAGDVLHFGDAARHSILNVVYPEWKFVGDFDPVQCVCTRLRLFEDAVRTGALVFSYHWPFPGIGHL